MAQATLANAKSFTSQLLMGRYFSAFAAILVLSFIGTSYIFGLYSNEIKTTLGYDQTTLNLISFFKDLGAYVSIHAGLIMEVYPPWVVLSIGAVLNFVGYFMVWLSVTHRVARPHLWQMCLYICIGANSFGFANTGALVTSVKNFPEKRGLVVGILKAYIGLGGAIMTQIYHALYGNSPNESGVILLIALLPAIPMLLFTYNIRDLKTANREVKKDKKFFTNVLYMSLVLVAFITVMIILQKTIDFSQGGYVASSAIVIALLFLPLILVFRDEFAVWKAKRDASNGLSELKIVQHEDNRLVSDGKSSDAKQVAWFQDVFSPPATGENHTILQAICSLDMCILIIAMICGAGGLLTTIDNLGQIGKSLGYPKKSISTLVSLLGIWQYLGRVMGGLISEFFLTRYKWPRPVFYASVFFLACIGHLLVAFDAPYGLYIASIIVGFSFGGSATYLVAIISELFGLKHYATLFNYGSLAGPLASFIFNVRVAGHLYDKEAGRQLQASGLTRMPGQSLNCTGVKCYQLAYIIITIASFLSGVALLILAYRTRKFYKTNIYERFQKTAAIEQSTANSESSEKDFEEPSKRKQGDH